MPDAPVNSFAQGNPLAMIRKLVDDGAFVLTNAGAPTDGTSGTFAGFAGIGSLLLDTTNGVVYVNGGTKASPTWDNLQAILASEIALVDGDFLVGNASNVAQARTMSGDVTITNTGVAAIAAQVIQGTELANVADDNVIGGVPVIHRINLASGADADTDVTLTHKTRVLDASVALLGAGTTGSIVTVKNSATAITDAIDVSSAADHDVVRAGQIIDAAQEIAASGTLRISHASTGGDFPGANVIVTGVRVA